MAQGQGPSARMIPRPARKVGPPAKPARFNTAAANRTLLAIGKRKARRTHADRLLQAGCIRRPAPLMDRPAARELARHPLPIDRKSGPVPGDLLENRIAPHARPRPGPVRAPISPLISSLRKAQNATHTQEHTPEEPRQAFFSVQGFALWRMGWDSNPR